jgi:hypothetical protein
VKASLRDETGSNRGPGPASGRRVLGFVLASLIVVTSLVHAPNANAQAGGTIVPTSPPFPVFRDRKNPVYRLYKFRPSPTFEPLHVRYTATNGVYLETLENDGSGREWWSIDSVKEFTVHNQNEVLSASIATWFEWRTGEGGTIVVELTGLDTVPGLNVKQPVVVRAVLRVPMLPESATTTSPTTTSLAPTPATTVVVTTAPTATPGPSPTLGSPGNMAPVANSSQVIVETASSGEVILQASDPEANPLTFALAQFPSNGKLTGQAPKLMYTPNPGFIGTDAFSFTVSDGAATSAPATITIIVPGSKPPPAPAATPTKSKAKKTAKKKSKVTAKR